MKGISLGIFSYIVSTDIGNVLADFFYKNTPVEEIFDEEHLRDILKEPWLAITFGPVLEELLFRGILQPGIQLGLQQLYAPEGFAEILSILFTSTVFALLHTDKISQLGSFLGGLIYGGVTALENGDISVAIMAHTLHNMISIIKASNEYYNDRYYNISEINQENDNRIRLS